MIYKLKNPAFDDLPEFHRHAGFNPCGHHRYDFQSRILELGGSGGIHLDGSMRQRIHAADSTDSRIALLAANNSSGDEPAIWIRSGQ